MNDAKVTELWEQSKNDAEGMRLGYTTQQHYFAALVRADERERLYGKDIDTLLFEEHQLAFEKGRRSEREACAKVCDEHAAKDGFEGCYANACAESIRARGNT